MKLKYYLRGLGIGIFVTTFLVARLQGSANVPDTTVQEQAEETHYLQELEQTETKEEEFLDNTEILQEMDAVEEPVQEEVEEQSALEEEEIASEEETTVAVEEIVEQTSPANDTKPETIESTEQFAMIPIYSGEGSETVARRLQDSGVVSSATALDKYLCQHGYDRKLVVGQHEVPFGATEEEIAQILCRK